MKFPLSTWYLIICIGLTLPIISACGQAGSLYIPQPAQQFTFNH